MKRNEIRDLLEIRYFLLTTDSIQGFENISLYSYLIKNVPKIVSSINYSTLQAYIKSFDNSLELMGYTLKNNVNSELDSQILILEALQRDLKVNIKLQ